VTPREFELGCRVAPEEPDVNDMTHGDTPTPASQDVMGEAIIPVAPASLLGAHPGGSIDADMRARSIAPWVETS
jgi:hypothetical protein